MSKIDRQGIRAPLAVPGDQHQFQQLLEDYPELADEVAGLVAWRDSGQPDRWSKAAERMFPSRRPEPYM
jgi:hypothetical protein